MTPRKPFSPSRNECLATAGKAIAGNEDALKFGKDLFLRDALVGGDQSQDGVQRPDTQKSVSRNRHPLMTRIFRLQDHVAADLVHNRVTPILAQVLRQIIPGEISRQLHQRGEGGLGKGKALVSYQMQPDAAWSRIESIEEVSSHGLIDRSAHRGPVIPLSHDWFRQALGDIAAIRLLRHLKDQLLHRRFLNPLSIQQQPLFFPIPPLRLCAS